MATSCSKRARQSERAGRRARTAVAARHDRAPPPAPALLRNTGAAPMPTPTRVLPPASSRRSRPSVQSALTAVRFRGSVARRVFRPRRGRGLSLRVERSPPTGGRSGTRGSGCASSLLPRRGRRSPRAHHACRDPVDSSAPAGADRFTIRVPRVPRRPERRRSTRGYTPRPRRGRKRHGARTGSRSSTLTVRTWLTPPL